MGRMQRWRLYLAVSAAVLMVVGLGACGDDDDEALAATCTAQVEQVQGFEAFFPVVDELLPQGVEDDSSPFSADVVQGLQAAFDEHIAPTLENFDVAPDPIRSDVEEGTALLRRFRAAPNPATLNRLRPALSGERIDAFLFDECGGERIEVVAADYEFRDLPSELNAGVIRIRFDNTGTEVHELAVISRKPGVTETFDEILQLSDDEQLQKVDFDGVAGGEPGTTTYGVVDLEAGEYEAVCYVPQGATPGNDGELRAPPHHTLGMRQRVTVS